MGEERDSDVMHVEYLIEPGLACMVTLVGVVLGSSTWPSTPPSEVFELVRGARSWRPELDLDESCIFVRSNLSLSAPNLGVLCTPDRPPLLSDHLPAKSDQPRT